MRPIHKFIADCRRIRFILLEKYLLLSIFLESKKPKDVKSSKAKTKVRNDKFGSKDEFKHPWLVTTLKGHASPVTSFDISQNGKYLASTATGVSLSPAVRCTDIVAM